MPTKHTLKILVGLQIAALLGTAVATALSIPPLVAAYGLPSYLISAGPQAFWLSNVLTIAFLAAAVGLCFFADVFRTLYVVLTLGLLLLHTIRPSVGSGPMDVLGDADAVLRGVIVALVYFSPLSDLYKPRARGDVRSNQRLLRYLILAQIPLILAGFGAVLLSYVSHPEFRAISDNFDRGHPGSGVVVGVTAVAFLVANVCLFLFQRRARTPYLLLTLVTVLEMDYLGPSFTPPGLELFSVSLTILNGIILGLIYFSPLQEVFGGGEPSRGPPSQRPPLPLATTTPASPEAAPATDIQPYPRDFNLPQERDSPQAVGAKSESPAFCACGAPSQGGKFCAQCGAPVLTQDRCPKCGAESEPDKKFCRECGNALHA